ncbi:hypothetical protein [Actinoplanes derwentensis]|uniref:Uncharacterized protein n=1 Tax=Actinoplanes derwentensis TaxID=113562 RepID=A0A1H2DBL5_9ACTN|nr:hypothetical protein [Actinoplanes derwentensis]GID87533.1 hypothetical protein Ade03nite_64570 [Actinoplanes derwentensis]SDT80145.1 hypothetical protein SAMN04489716_9081 [Actinoplanes derwentensis]
MSVEYGLIGTLVTRLEQRPTAFAGNACFRSNVPREPDWSYFGHRQEHGGVLESFERVPGVRDREQVAGGAVGRRGVGRETDTPVEDLQRRLAGIFVLVEALARDESYERLAQGAGMAPYTV